jgi:hypothetical protein
MKNFQVGHYYKFTETKQTARTVFNGEGLMDYLLKGRHRVRKLGKENNLLGSRLIKNRVFFDNDEESWYVYIEDFTDVSIPYVLRVLKGYEKALEKELPNV